MPSDAGLRRGLGRGRRRFLGAIGARYNEASAGQDMKLGVAE